MSRIAIIQVRGIIGLKKPVKDTLTMLNLHRKNSCVLVRADPSSVGMLTLVKDFVTWGELDKETFKELLKKRGRIAGNQLLTEEYLKKNAKLSFDEFTEEFMKLKKELRDIPGLKKYFRLTPPRKGFERGGIKIPFSMGGALGYRGNKINDLIKRML
ncbi:MAG: 50S ribosomal protein L30 [Candidatus Nanoarchaeia archaeon]|nr:50S ribosomal protein L30 [Candidatus Nanoarchaeia archaeon]MDD5587716.1 50S ribosomal protein L30 [Candidatus Nanoarchaeia archaeon]